MCICLSHALPSTHSYMHVLHLSPGRVTVRSTGQHPSRGAEAGGKGQCWNSFEGVRKPGAQLHPGTERRPVQPSLERLLGWDHKWSVSLQNTFHFSEIHEKFAPVLQMQGKMYISDTTRVCTLNAIWSNYVVDNVWNCSFSLQSCILLYSKMRF